MRPARGRRFADALLILTCALMVVAVFLEEMAPERVSVEPSWGSTGLLGAALLLLPGAAFVAVGWLIATRRLGNRIGWMCLTIGLLWTVLMSTGSLGHWIIQKRGLADELGLWVLWVGDWLYAMPLGLIGTHLLLRLPDGRLLSRRWRHYSRFCTAVIVVFSLSLAVELDTVSGIAGTANPSLRYLE